MKVLIPLKNPLELPDITQDPMTVKTFKYVVYDAQTVSAPADQTIYSSAGSVSVRKDETGPIWIWGNQVDQALPLIENECLNLS